MEEINGHLPGDERESSGLSLKRKAYLILVLGVILSGALIASSYTVSWEIVSKAADNEFADIASVAMGILLGLVGLTVTFRLTLRTALVEGSIRAYGAMVLGVSLSVFAWYLTVVISGELLMYRFPRIADVAVWIISGVVLLLCLAATFRRAVR